MRLILILPVVLAVLLTGCVTQQRSDQLDTTLRAYGSAVRWGDFQAALKYIDPEQKKEHPLSTLEMSRYAQYKVSEYDDSTPPEHTKPGEVHQDVKIELININTQSPRKIVDHQVWKYDAETKHWYLQSGLPDLDQQ